MDIHDSVRDDLSTLPAVQAWSEVATVIQRVAASRPRDWRLPALACEAVGGSQEYALPAAVALACAQISIILVDDMLDDDPRGEYHRVGYGQAGNLALAFQSLGLDVILSSSVSLEARLAALRCLNHMMWTTAYGQHLDVQPVSDEAAYWRVVENKSAPFYGAALQLGGWMAEATEEVANGLESFGRIYGAMIQIHDDLNDTMAVPANPDWIQGRSPLPILFARIVNHPERTHFLDLYKHISEEGALQEAQKILIHCGAVSYCVDQLMRRHQAAHEILASIPFVRREALETLLKEIIAPVRRLFEEVRKIPPR